MVCKDDEVQGISNEPMPLAFVQNTINDNGGQNFDYCLTNMFSHDNYEIAYNVQGQDFKTYCLIKTNDKMYNSILSKIGRLVVLHLIKCPKWPNCGMKLAWIYLFSQIYQLHLINTTISIGVWFLTSLVSPSILLLAKYAKACGQLKSYTLKNSYKSSKSTKHNKIAKASMKSFNGLEKNTLTS